MYKNLFIGFIACFLLTSCTTVPPRGSFAGATIIGEDSDVFIFIPVQHNKELLTKILPEYRYVKKAIDKTDFLYLSLMLKNLHSNAFPNVENTSELAEHESPEIVGETEEHKIEDVVREGQQREIGKQLGGSIEEADIIEENTESNLFNLVSYDLCAIGSYPSKLLHLFLTKKNGWTRKKGNEGYTYYQKENEEKKSFSFFSMPTKDLALFSYNTCDEDKMEEVLERVDKPHPVYFDEDFEMAIQQGNPSNDICIFVSNSHFFLSKLLGINLDLPIKSLKVYLTKDISRAKEVYTYSIILEVKNLTAGFATRLLLSKLLKTQVRINGSKIVVEKAKVTSERLVELIQKVILK